MADLQNEFHLQNDRPGPEKTGMTLRRVLALPAAALVWVSIGLAWIHLILPAVDYADVPLIRHFKPKLSANDYQALVDRLPLLVFGVAFCIALGLMALSVFVLVAWIKPRKPKEPKRIRWARLPLQLLIALALILILVVGAIGFFEKTYLHGAEHRSSFENHCGRCHFFTRPLDFFQERAGWEKTVRRMASKTGSGIDEKTADAIIQYLVGVRSISIERFVEGRCSMCHVPPAKHSLDQRPQKIRRSIDRLRALDPRFCEPARADELAAYLSSGHASGDKGASALSDRFEQSCETCHFLDVIHKPIDQGTWKDVLVRMQQKAPHLLSREQSLELLALIQAERADPEGFARRYPHSGLSSAWKKP